MSDRLLKAFRYRSGRVIAVSRTVMTWAFLGTLWFDPSQPTQYPETAYVLISIYAVLSLAILLFSWNDWWFDARISKPLHVFDITAFGALVLLTDGYTSPFYIFFVFLILSATLRWGWRETTLTAIAVTLIFFLSGMVALAIGIGEFELNRFTFRGTSLGVLSFILIWFGINLLGPQHRWRSAEDIDADGPEDVAGAAVDFVAAELEARIAVLLWEEREEPWMQVVTWSEGAMTIERMGPAKPSNVIIGAIDYPFVFKGYNARIADAAVSRDHRKEQRIVDFARGQGIEEGLAAPIEAADYAGVLLIGGIDGLCRDDIPRIGQLASEIALGFDRHSRLSTSSETARHRAQSEMAMELHDSVMQSLTGVQMRLKSFERMDREADELLREISDLREDVALDQRNLRWLIERSRNLPAERGRKADLCTSLSLLCRRLARQWQVECNLACKVPEIYVSLSREHAIHQVAREALANAVRHGHASEFSITVRQQGGELVVAIVDNGDGFISGSLQKNIIEIESGQHPRSIRDRVESLGGKLGVTSSPQGSALRITLPSE